MGMYTDPNHIHTSDPGKIEGNVVFTYLDIFDENKKEVAKLKEQYQRGGLGDVEIKKRLIDILENVISPIRTRRREFAKKPEYVEKLLREGTEKTQVIAKETMKKVREVIKINYF
jgi:tryptophanyl-tRNA synthetase